MTAESGYSNQKKKGQVQFNTINPVGSDKFGTPTIQKTLFEITPSALTIDSITNISRKDGQVEFWKVEMVGHGASKYDVMRMITGNSIAFEFDIIQIIDADFFYVLPISDTKPVATETAKILRWITANSDSDGNLIVSVVPALLTTLGVPYIGANKPLVVMSTSNVPAIATAAGLLLRDLSANPLATTVKKIKVIEDQGRFLLFTTDSAGTAIIGTTSLGGGEIECLLTPTSKIYVHVLLGSAIVTGNLVVQFLG